MSKRSKKTNNKEAPNFINLPAIISFAASPPLFYSMPILCLAELNLVHIAK